MFYSKTTGGFYLPEIHGDKTPSDAIEIPETLYKEMMEAQSAGKKIVADEKGFPIATDYPEPTAEEQQSMANAEARAYLAKTDWYITRKIETGVEVPEDILTKRAEARAAVKGV